MPKKNANTIKPAKPVTVEISILDGVNIHDEDTLREALEAVAEAQDELKKVNDFITVAKNQATTYMNSHDMPVIQLDGRYWRRIQRMNRFFVATDKDMPNPAPKGAKSLKSLCQGKVVGPKKISLWNFVTKRVVDHAKVDEAVNRGWLKQDQVDKAYLESPQNPFIQKFDGEAIDAEE
jgi:Txe/YoeB family toxin of Txe-Axe toxin-antitoxin module